MSMLLFMYVGSGILLILIAMPLYFQKVPPNGLYGFRVRRTMENPELWYPVNRYGAGWLMFIGLASVIGAVGLYFFPGLSVDTYALCCLAVFVGIFGLGIGFTVRYVNSLPGN